MTTATVKALNTNAIDVMAAAIKAGGVIIDDHSESGRTLKATAVSYFEFNGKIHVVPHVNVPHCLNPLYIDEKGDVRLSINSVGGTIRPDTTPSLEAAIASFNEQSTASEFGSWGALTGTVYFN